jgi:uncharacterized membrane protein
MGKDRLQAFSDGVIAIIITIMVLDLKAPNSDSLSDMRPLIPLFFSYAISYIYVGIYWNNHHHLFHAVTHVDGRILWANLHLLFWLSLIPVATHWVDKSSGAPWPVAIYGCVLFLCAIAFTILTWTLVARHGRDSTLAQALGRDYKGKVSLLLYAIGIPCSFINPWIAQGFYIAVACMWLVPDRRIVRHLEEHKPE